MKIYLLAPFIIFSILANAQTAEVIGESDLTTEQKRVQHIENDLIRPKQDEYKKLLIKLNLGTYVGKRGWEGTSDKVFINEMIDKHQAVIDKINLSRLRSLCNDIDGLESQIGKNRDACSRINTIIKDSNSEIEKATRRLNKLNGIERDDEAKESAHNITISDIEREIELADNKSKNLDSELKGLKSTNKTKSLDDFLATNTNSADTDDFLASPSNNSSNGSDDFLANDNEGSKSDFLSESNTVNKDFKIEYKNGLTGVVDSKGKTLIPFKKWEIEEYKNGIAKVRVLFDEYKYEINNSEGYHGTVYKTGFVDISGSFLDDPLVSVIGGCYDFQYRLRLERSSDTRSEDEKDKAWARYDRKRELLKRECFNKFTQWKINTIKKYQ